MAHLGWEVAGIENHPPYAASARELVPEADITVADAFDVETFDADLVYMYRPMRSDRDTCRLEQHVVSCVPSGTVMFLPMRDVSSLGLGVVTREVGIK